MMTFFKGRVALYAILQAMGVGMDDEIILPGFTCVVVPNAIIYLGARPVYVDIDPSSYNIDPDKIEEKITDRTRAIIAQHTFGIPADMDRIIDIARRSNLYVIEDSCHSVGSKYKGRGVGTFGDASFFSSQWSKPVTTGLGGWATINNHTLLENMKNIYPEFITPSPKERILLRLQYLAYENIISPSLFWFAQNTYRRLSSAGITIGSSSDEEMRSTMPADYKKKMGEWQRQILEQKLRQIERTNRHRREVVSLYQATLKKKGIEAAPSLAEGCEPIYLRYPIRVRHKDALLKKAKEMRIEMGDWFLSPVHPNLEGWEKAGYERGACPNAEMACQLVINLPTHEGIGIKEVERIVDLLDHREVY